MKSDWFKVKFINLWPPFFFTGIKVLQKSDDLRYMKVRLKLRFWNANYVGTAFGGSIFSLTDAFYMLMLINNLDKSYIVWDKAATIRYLKPGKTDLTAEYRLTEEDLQLIKDTVEKEGRMNWIRKVEVKNSNGEVIAEVDRTVYVKKRT